MLRHGGAEAGISAGSVNSLMTRIERSWRRGSWSPLEDQRVHDLVGLEDCGKGRDRPVCVGECPGGFLHVRYARGGESACWRVDRAPQVAVLSRGFTWRTGTCREKGSGSRGDRAFTKAEIAQDIYFFNQMCFFFRKNQNPTFAGPIGSVGTSTQHKCEVWLLLLPS